MISPSGKGSIRRIYILTAVFTVLGFGLLWPMQGFRTAAAFLLGCLASLGSLYLFGYVARAITPGPRDTKPWEARAFITRYLLLFAGGYVIVRVLGTSPLAMISGMLVSTAAAVVSLIVELLERLFTKSTTR